MGKADGIAHLSPTTATATMKLGTGGRIAIAADGTVYGLDAHTAKVYTVGAGSNTAHEIVTLNEGEPIAADPSPWSTANQWPAAATACTSVGAISPWMAWEP